MCVFVALFSLTHLVVVALYIVFFVCSIEYFRRILDLNLSGPAPALLYFLLLILLRIGSSLYKLLEKYRALLTLYNSYTLFYSYNLPHTLNTFWVFSFFFIFTFFISFSICKFSSSSLRALIPLSLLMICVVFGGTVVVVPPAVDWAAS